ncbi:hypothetical protein B0T26DRAFT_755513 [Lasiosphaeria miniovina]|uniref:Uncharacterized protein n=1 Tax=Lasiosphaeria miniovina TaxID=1954250 RepID=A0AA39ZYF2_9PEZI|nr:uncharacterized protein B0T26DRAFT_755513 [Lasiosphaeria miniovina]KAK0705955.1 hypothetical protein B0T26DRAFT_755513 [Lasiosphaeria miniovina]
METLSRRVLPDSTPQLVDSANGSASASANTNAMANPTGHDSDAVPAGGDGSVSHSGSGSGSDDGSDDGSDSSTADSSTATQTAPRRASYFVAADELPEPLPTDAAIAAPTQVLKDVFGCMVVRVGEHYVAKYGTRVSLTEGENMLFARDTCGLPEGSWHQANERTANQRWPGAKKGLGTRQMARHASSAQRQAAPSCRASKSCALTGPP